MMPRTQITIGELERRGAIVKIQDGNHGEKHPVAADYVPTGIPFLMARDIKDVVDLIGCKFITRRHADSLRIGFARSGDVLLTHKGTVGSVAVMPHIEDYAMLTPQVTYYRVDDNQLSNRYLRYAFADPDFQARLKGVSAQSTRPYIGITAQRNLEITWVARPNQERIASILSAYDDLVENKTRRIKILEEMAQMIYREWFVNFRFPGHENVKLVESESGPIPEGWSVEKLRDVAGVNARSIKNSSLPDEIHYIDIASVSTARIEKKFPMLFADAPGRARRIVRHGDTIWSTVRPNRRSYALILNPERNLIVSTGFAVLTATTVPYSYLYLAVTTDEFADYLTNHATGSAYPAVTGKDFENAELMVPEVSLRDRFHQTTAPMLDLAWCLHRRNANLRTTRDLLLPKLISGEVSVEAANEQAAAELIEQTA